MTFTRTGPIYAASPPVVAATATTTLTSKPLFTRRLTMFQLLHEDLARARMAERDRAARGTARRTSLQVALDAAKRRNRELSR